MKRSFGIALFAVLMLASATTGADFSRYADWADVAQVGHFWRAQTYTISPLGVPLLMWSHGTGFVYAAVDRGAGALADVRLGALLIGWSAALVFWAATLAILWQVSGRSRSITAFSAAVAALGTHAGYFSNTHASESLALACAAVLAWLVFDDEQPGPSRGLTAGLAIGFLITIKSYWAVYAAGPAVVLAWRWRRSPGAPARRALAALLFIAPVAIAVAQTALTNRWMTGSSLRSSYAFGDAEFRSFDFADPELLAVLFHPLHGLLSHHPFYALGLLCVIAAVVTCRDAGQRLFFVAGALAIVANLWAQAAWVVWWLGNATFGMRGMALATTVVVPAFALVLRRARDASPRRFALLGATAAVCCYWSFLLMLEGSTRFHSVRELLEAQAYLFGTFWGPPAMIAAAGALALAALDADRFRRGDRPAAVLSATTCVLLGLWTAYFVLQIVERPFAEVRTLLVGGGGALAALGVAAFVVDRGLLRRTTGGWAKRVRRAGRGAPPVGVYRGPVGVYRGLAIAAAAGLFVASTVMFVRLARNVEGDIAAGRPPRRAYAFTNTFSVRDMRESCNEYRRIPGFDDKREAFKRFLIRQGVDPTDFRF